MIFDEVDVGIGGATSEMVGQMLSQLSTKNQVLCITHQAQVASWADNHIKINKKITEEKTETKVEKLSPKQRVTEVARMIGGIEISEKTIAHAQEMLTKS